MNINIKEQYIAHSKETIKDTTFDAQLYQDHIVGVYNNALNILNRIEKFVKPEIFNILKKVVLIASIYHDLGKLDEKSQLILKGKSNDKMLNHVDAGVAYLLGLYKKTKDSCYLISSYLILSHHIGLPNYYKVFSQERSFLKYIISPKKNIRDHHIMSKYNMGRKMVKTHVNKCLKKYIFIHNQICNLQEPEIETDKNNTTVFLTNPLLLKIAISILVDADHEDTAKNYGDIVPHKIKKLNPENKMKNLFSHIETLKDNGIANKTANAIERFNLRQEFFKSCCDTELDDNFFLIDGTVGIGKTMGTMCLSLRLAMKYKLDNLIFVLPYISLIDQSAEQYHKGLFGSNKTTDYELGIIHSMWKSKNVFHRQYQKGFNAPVNLTTSIHFFDVLVSNHTSTFKHLHKFIGSVICFDEYHTLHADFWGMALKMMDGLSKNFSCHFILSSGTPTFFWDIDEINNLANGINPKRVINSDIYAKMIKMEEGRVSSFYSAKEEYTFEELANKLLDKTESIFIVFNTRKKAFGFLNTLENKTERKIFLRYSGMAPIDRQRQLNKIKDALANNEAIILIATQGSEVGLDLSFRHGFKELSDYDSIIQMSGRMNRHYEYDDSFLHIFELSKKANGDDTEYGNNPQNAYRIEITKQNSNLLNNLSPKYCTNITEKEVASISTDYMNKIAGYWDNKRFEDLDNDFSIISLPMISVLINIDIYLKILRNEYVPYSDLQNNIVNLIYSEKQMNMLKNHLEKIDDKENDSEDKEDKEENRGKIKQKFFNLYYWKGEYDPERYGIFCDSVFGIIDETKITKKYII